MISGHENTLKRREIRRGRTKAPQNRTTFGHMLWRRSRRVEPAPPAHKSGPVHVRNKLLWSVREFMFTSLRTFVEDLKRRPATAARVHRSAWRHDDGSYDVDVSVTVFRTTRSLNTTNARDAQTVTCFEKSVRFLFFSFFF